MSFAQSHPVDPAGSTESDSSASAAAGFAACLEILKDVEAARIEPRPVLHQLKTDLKYFYDQAIRDADPEGRASINRASVTLRWEHFLLALEKSECKPRFHEGANWAALEKFAKGEARIANTADSDSAIGHELDWDVEKLFHHLIATIQRLPTPRGVDRNLALIGLRYLVVECERPKAKRDRKWISCAWSAVHPILEAEGLLAPFKSERRVKERLRLFVRGD